MIKIHFEKKAKKKTTFKEFSKRALTAIIICWFIGAVFGIAAVCIQITRGAEYTNLSDVLLYIGAPMTGGVIAYMIKSAAENVPKIKKGNDKENGESEEDII